MEYYTTNCYGYSTTYYTGSCLHARKRTGDDTLITCLHIAAFSKYVMRLFSIEQSIMHRLPVGGTGTIRGGPRWDAHLFARFGIK
jgi:hypothetical protein